MTSPAVTPLDMDAERARLRDVRGSKLWRSLEEPADSEGFRAWLQREHPQLANMAPVDRRGFLKFIGASVRQPYPITSFPRRTAYPIFWKLRCY